MLVPFLVEAEDAVEQQRFAARVLSAGFSASGERGGNVAHQFVGVVGVGSESRELQLGQQLEREFRVGRDVRPRVVVLFVEQHVGIVDLRGRGIAVPCASAVRMVGEGGVEGCGRVEQFLFVVDGLFFQGGTEHTDVDAQEVVPHHLRHIHVGHE